MGNGRGLSGELRHFPVIVVVPLSDQLIMRTWLSDNVHLNEDDLFGLGIFCNVRISNF